MKINFKVKTEIERECYIHVYIHKISAAQINPLTRVDVDTKGFCLQVYM